MFFDFQPTIFIIKNKVKSQSVRRVRMSGAKRIFLASRFSFLVPID